ncbi:hypothetical protein GALL_268170 [mine drainage metagenome]|uniref:Uncharacterized protein n=1 Tax=mine drainage metagenome TaxID=410659 RepID=A0A1J5RP55_9ZZZZ
MFHAAVQPRRLRCTHLEAAHVADWRIERAGALPERMRGGISEDKPSWRNASARRLREINPEAALAAD